MASSKVRVTSRCAPSPSDGQILLPEEAKLPKGRRVLVSGNQKSKLMKVGVRSDSGQAACLGGGALSRFGGEGAEVEYRSVTFLGVLWRDKWLGLQFVASVLTTVGALITAWLTYGKNSADDAGSFANNTAIVALVIAAIIAIAKFVKEYRDL